MIKRYRSPREKRKARVRAKIRGTLTRPRLSVFRSNRYIYAQLINDERGKTLVTASEFNLRSGGKPATLKKKKSEKTENLAASDNSVSSVLQEKHPKTERARLVGKILAQKALKAGIRKVVFDRGPYKYHGRVKALAEGVRKGGLKF